MNIALIGGTGLLGSNLLKLYSNHEVKSFSREQSYNIDTTINTTIDFNYLEDELIYMVKEVYHAGILNSYN